MAIIDALKVENIELKKKIQELESVIEKNVSEEQDNLPLEKWIKLKKKGAQENTQQTTQTTDSDTSLIHPKNSKINFDNAIMSIGNDIISNDNFSRLSNNRSWLSSDLVSSLIKLYALFSISCTDN